MSYAGLPFILCANLLNLAIACCVDKYKKMLLSLCQETAAQMRCKRDGAVAINILRIMFLKIGIITYVICTLLLCILYSHDYASC